MRRRLCRRPDRGGESEVTPFNGSLKYLAFFAALAETTVEEDGRETLAVLLTLRMIDTWFNGGEETIAPDSIAMDATRRAIAALTPASAMSRLLFQLLNTVQAMSRVDVVPILPLLNACAEEFIGRGRLALGADILETIVDLAHPEDDTALHVDVTIRLGFCQRELGLLDAAEATFIAAGQRAAWHRDHPRALRSRAGVANVTRMRGNLRGAGDMLDDVAAQARAIGAREIEALALSDRAIVAMQQGELGVAISLCYASIELSDTPYELDARFGNIGAFLIRLGRFAAARDAMRLKESVALNEKSRTVARINLLAIAARTPNREEFERMCGLLDNAAMSVEERINLRIETARGLIMFGDPDGASVELKIAIANAESIGLNRSIFEAEDMLKTVRSEAGPGNPHIESPTKEIARIEQELYRRACALTG